MIRIKEIQKAFSGLVGWRQPYASQQAQCSESGLYYQDAHPLLTLENMRSVMPGGWERQYPEWDKAKAYKQGDKVAYAPQIWIATADNTGQLPEQGSAYWQPFDTLTDYLGTLTESGTAAVVQTFLQMKQLQQQTRNLLERRTFFDGAGRIKATLQNRHKVAGFEIVPVRSMGVTAKIERVGLQMYGGTGDVTLYLFHSSQPEPVKTYTLPFTATNGGFQWFELEDCYLPYIGDGTNAGGAWYLCYDQDSLPLGMEAVNMSKDWSREPCGTCNAGDVEAWRELTKYLQISPFMVASPQGFRDNPLLWDISGNIYTNTANYGLNCMVTVGCDLTGFSHGRAGGWPKYFQKGDEAHGAAETLQYYDVVNFARRLHCPVFFSFGYNDDTCSPTSTYATYNEITAPKKLAVTPTSGHWRFPETNDEAMEWMKLKVKK